jgi:hypothetical protein
MIHAGPLATMTMAILVGMQSLVMAATPQSTAAIAPHLTVSVTVNPNDSSLPRVGDQLTFHSVIVNRDVAGAAGVIVWLTLLRLDAGHEQAMDLEDWTNDAVLSVEMLPSTAVVRRNWKLRLIAPGTYRVLVNAVTRDAAVPVVAASEIFLVLPKPIVESSLVLSLALGFALALGSLVAWRLKRCRARGVRASAE